MVFTALMSLRSNLWLKDMMVLFAVLSLFSFALVLFLKESPLILGDETSGEERLRAE